MSALAASLSDGKLAGRVFDERQLAEAIGGSDARRYALVNRALKDGTLIRLKRGTYLFPQSSRAERSEEHTSELQSLMRISYAVFCLKKKKNKQISNADDTNTIHNTNIQ